MPHTNLHEAPEVIDAGYSGAVDHYTSPNRRDAVKEQWEEVSTRRVLDQVVRHLGTQDPLRVLDIGCGSGDGLALLQSTPAARRRWLSGMGLEYVGVDVNRELLDTGRRMHAHLPQVDFSHGDMRDGLPPGDYHIYLSTGVPYSHLTRSELADVLATIFGAVGASRRPAAVVVDVLARYSIEWTSMWSQSRWPYNMSFFHSSEKPASTPMTFYSGPELTTMVGRAAESAGCRLDRIEAYDRSIMVGRHTATGEYNPDLPRYRDLVNGLHDPWSQVDFDDVLLDLALPAAPRPIVDFFTGFADAWNSLVRLARDGDAVVRAPDQVASIVQPMLAHGLQCLERDVQKGLGVGHSLTVVAFVG